jgi:hypothetical protein
MVVRFCRPINAADYQPADKGELARRVHSAIADVLPPDQRPLS